MRWAPGAAGEAGLVLIRGGGRPPWQLYCVDWRTWAFQPAGVVNTVADAASMSMFGARCMAEMETATEVGEGEGSGTNRDRRETRLCSLDVRGGAVARSQVLAAQMRIIGVKAGTETGLSESHQVRHVLPHLD
jgi:hypothetical protein